MKKEPNWFAFKKAEGTELEILELKRRIKELEEKIEVLWTKLNLTGEWRFGQEDKKKVSSGSSEV